MRFAAAINRIALSAGLAACFGLFVTAARADDSILRRGPGGKDVTVNGDIQDETPAGIRIKVGKDIQLILPEDILFVGYNARNLPDVDPLMFGNLHGKEDQAMSLTGEDRQKGLADALAGYQKLEKQLKSAPNALRYVQYRMAMLAVDQAKIDSSKAGAAIQALNAYRSANAGGWEIVPATRAVARLLEDSGDKAGARQAYEQLAANPDLPQAVQLSTSLLLARMLVRDKKYPEAEQKLKAVLAGTTDEKLRAYVQVYLAQSQVAQGSLKDAEKPLRDAAKGDGDDNLKALAYNALGDFYLKSNQPDEAFWQYLRVDALYSQDREELARALYNLWKLFDSTRGDPQRARECLERLKDKSLDGTEYHDLAVKESTGETKAP